MRLDEAMKAARKNGLSAVSANRLVELAREFASPEAFFASPKGTVLAQWRRMHPDAKRDLGSGFWKDFDSVRLLMAAEPDRAAAPSLQTVLSLADVKSVVDAMELLDMTSISVGEMLSILDVAAKRKAARK